MVVKGAPDCRFLVGRVLQLHYSQGQPVDEEDNVRAPSILPLGNRELVDRQPVVSRRVLEVDEPGLRAGDAAVRPLVLDAYFISEHAVEATVAADQRWVIEVKDLADGVLQRLVGEGGIQALQGQPKAAGQHGLAVAVPLCIRLTRRDLGAAHS